MRQWRQRDGKRTRPSSFEHEAHVEARHHVPDGVGACEDAEPQASQLAWKSVRDDGLLQRFLGGDVHRNRSRAPSRGCPTHGPWRDIATRPSRTRHEPDFLALTPDEDAAIWRLIAQCRVILDREHRPLGYNLGVNVGEAAGQTVAHGPLHVIPRYAGDVLPDRARYWAEG
jgi:HIT domain-containing protein